MQLTRKFQRRWNEQEDFWSRVTRVQPPELGDLSPAAFSCMRVTGQLFCKLPAHFLFSSQIYSDGVTLTLHHTSAERAAASRLALSLGRIQEPTHDKSPLGVGLGRPQRLPRRRHVQDVGVQLGRHDESTAKGRGRKGRCGDGGKVWQLLKKRRRRRRRDGREGVKVGRDVSASPS